jgi:hypothetical protein
MARATHSGECQLCAHRQLLPGGRLSLHGYDVRWGFFNGICPGSRELPYEQSAALLPAAIASQARAAASLRESALKLRTRPVDDGKVFVSWETDKTDKRGRRISEGREVTVTVEATERDGYTSYAFFLTDASGETRTLGHKFGYYGYGSDRLTTVEGVIRWFDGKRADALDEHAAQIERYVVWLEARLAGWALKPLTERTDLPAEGGVTLEAGAVRVGDKILRRLKGVATWCEVTKVFPAGQRVYLTTEAGRVARKRWDAVVVQPNNSDGPR